VSIFWLEICWDVVKHSKTPFLQLWWGSWIMTGRKWLELKKPNLWFLPLGPPHQQKFNFCDHNCKGKVCTDILCRKFFSYLFELYGCLNGRNWFLSLRENPPKTTSQWRHRWAPPTAKDAVLSAGSNDL